jgi:hypothetical protein
MMNMQNTITVGLSPEGDSVHLMLQLGTQPLVIPLTGEQAAQFGGLLTSFGGAVIALKPRTGLIAVNGPLPNGT